MLNFDKLTYAGNLDNLKDIQNNKKYNFIKGDISTHFVQDMLIQTGIEKEE